MLCSRHSASVQSGRRFFTLTKENEDLVGGQVEDGEGEGEDQLPASLAGSDQDAGSQEAANMVSGSGAMPVLTAVAVKQKEATPSVPVGNLAAGPAGKPVAKQKEGVPSSWRQDQQRSG
jgi:hypothetical protein